MLLIMKKTLPSLSSHILVACKLIFESLVLTGYLCIWGTPTHSPADNKKSHSKKITCTDPDHYSAKL